MVKSLLAWLKRRFRSRRLRRNLLIVLGIFIALNLLVFFFYQKRTYPNTKVANKPFGSVTSAKIGDRIQDLGVLPENIQLNFNSQTASASTQSLGIVMDSAQMHKDALNDRSWLPVWNFVRKHNVPLYVTVDDITFSDGLLKAVGNFQQEAADAKLVLENGEFKIVPEVLGHKLNVATAKQAVLDSIATSDFAIDLPADVTEPTTKQDRLQTTLQSLKTQISTPVTLSYNDKTKKLTPAEIANLFAEGDKTFDVSEVKVRSFVIKVGSEFGIGVKNINEAASAIANGIIKNKEVNFKLEATPKAVKSYSYCVAARGVDASNLDALSIKLAAVFADSRGWSLDGQVAFTKTSSGCNFTVWLAAPDQMSSFGAICEPEWSCRVGDDVVINFNRWQNASPAWTAGGGNLDDYRSMVINHETGHYLGFGHPSCGGAGQLAPVMQQQSIDLQGCKFNPWPLPSELAELRTKLGI